MSFLHIILSINISLQQQIHFNGIVFGNKCCRCNEDSLYRICNKENVHPDIFARQKISAFASAQSGQLSQSRSLTIFRYPSVEA